VSGGESIQRTTKPAAGLYRTEALTLLHMMLYFLSSVLAESKRKIATETRRGKDIHN
jgi:hypothetical protein